MLRSLGVLRYRDFRLLTLSTLFFYAARWMEVVVQGWLVLEITDSPFLVGVTGALRFAGWGLGPLWGAVSDRLERRRLLIAVQGFNALAALGLLTLLAADRLEVWQLFLAVLLVGTTQALDFPARNALVGDVVGAGELLNAMALNRAAQNLTTVIGPLLGGSFLLLAGYLGAYWVVVALYLANLLVVLSISRMPAASLEPGVSVWQELRQGLGQFLQEPNIRALLVLAALANLLAFPLTYALMPVFARDVLRVGVGGLGLLTAAIGAGGLLSNLSLASLGRSRHQSRLVMVGFVLWPVALVGFAVSPWYPLSLGLLFIGGVFQDFAIVSSSSLLLGLVSEEMRGRVMGLRGLAVTTMLVGNLVAGALTEQFGAPSTLVLFGGLGTLFMGITLLSAPRLRRLRD